MAFFSTSTCSFTFTGLGCLVPLESDFSIPKLSANFCLRRGARLQINHRPLLIPSSRFSSRHNHLNPNAVSVSATPETVSISKITGLAKSMIKRCIRIEGLTHALDIVGTGGDGANTVNISTGACILAAACGARVKLIFVWHYENSINRMKSSNVSQRLLVAPVRKALKVKTVFNILGPMLNPARVPYAVVGVYNEGLVVKMARALQNFGMQRALVVHSEGLDEMSPLGPGLILDVTPEKIEKFPFEPCIFLFHPSVLNAAAGLLACGHVKGLKEGVSLAREIHQSGKALSVLDSWVHLSQDSTQERIDVMGSDIPRSPDASYSNSFPGNEDEAKEPPMVPPHLQHSLLNSPVNGEASSSLPQPQNVILNHLYIGNGENTRSVVALGLTHRFRSKFVTVVLYKPVRRRGM